MEKVSLTEHLFFVIQVILVLGLFYRTTQNKALALIVFAWILIQSALAIGGFYQTTDTQPPRILLFILPPAIGILLSVLTLKGRTFLHTLKAEYLYGIHALRTLVEVTLYLLAQHRLVPEIMTFQGWNLDILSGLSACILLLLSIKSINIPRPVLLLWNITALALLFNIVRIGILSAPSPFQQYAHNQPNIAILYFPYCLLPTFIVPTVLFAHIALLIGIVNKNAHSNKNN